MGFLFQHRVWQALEKDPIFSHGNVSKDIDEQRENSFLQTKKFFEYLFLKEEDIMSNPFIAKEFIETLGSYNWSTSAKYMLNVQVCESLSLPRIGNWQIQIDIS